MASCLRHELVIVAMWPNPKPVEAISPHLAKSAIVTAHANRPKSLDVFEAQRGMTKIGIEEGVIFVGQFAHLARQSIVEKPEIRCGEVVHRQAKITRLTLATLKRPALSSLGLFLHSLEDGLEAPRFHIAGDLTVPSVRLKLLNPLGQIC